MKAAITGASGFIGTELLEELGKRDDIEIIALTRSERASESIRDSCACEWKRETGAKVEVPNFRSYTVEYRKE